MGGAHRTASPPALLALVEKLRGNGRGRGIDTSAGLLFNHTFWARDRVLTALDLLDRASEPATETVLALAALQGTRRTVRSEEEPGRIHSEQRNLFGWRAPLWLKLLFGLGLSSIWGGTPAGYTTYFASDSTPLFIILVAALADREPGILDATVTRKDGRVATVRDSVAEACGWIAGHVNDDGLVWLEQSNILALQQVWKDGPTSNFDEHGRMPNLAGPMAYLDVQVLAAEALGRAARLPGPRQARRPPERLGRQHLHVEIGHRTGQIGHAAMLVEVRGRSVLPDLLQGQDVRLLEPDEAVVVHVSRDPAARLGNTVAHGGHAPVLARHRGIEDARLAVGQRRHEDDEQRRRVRREVGGVPGRRATPDARQAKPEQELEPERRPPAEQVALLAVDAARLFFGAHGAARSLQGRQGEHGLGGRLRGPVEQVERGEDAVARPEGVVEQQPGARVDAAPPAVPTKLLHEGQQGRRRGRPMRSAHRVLLSPRRLRWPSDDRRCLVSHSGRARSYPVVAP
jgi:hypothetical protein